MRAFEVGVMNYEKFADDVVSYYTDGKLPSQGPLDYRYIPFHWLKTMSSRILLVHSEMSSCFV